MPKDDPRVDAPTLKDQCDAYQHMFPDKHNSIQTTHFVIWAVSETAAPAPLWVAPDMLN